MGEIDAKAEAAGRPVLVTGASKGIGAGIARRLGALGHPVTVHYGGDRAGAQAVADDIIAAGGRADTLGFDVADRTATRAALETAVEAGGAYWGVVLSAGIIRDGAFPALTDADWDGVLRTNLDGFYNVLHPLSLPMIRRRDGGRTIPRPRPG
jgi:3-oxoacyl-[acyl-carrier protein] reductase